MKKNSSKYFLMGIIAVCAILLFSPVDLLSGGHIDDLVYAISAAASLLKMRALKAGNSEEQDVYDEET